MPTPHLSNSSPATLLARSLVVDRGGARVLDGVTLSVNPGDVIGIVGANGAGKSTLLMALAGLVDPESGAVSIDPPEATIGYLAQEHQGTPGQSVRAALAERTGVAGAEEQLVAAAHALASGTREATERYERALDHFTNSGAADFDARVAVTLEAVGADPALADHDSSTLSGGEAAKVALCAIELSRFAITLLDEPTNNLDFMGLERLEAWVGRQRGGLVIVSHDRAFLERCVTHVVEIDSHTHLGALFAGGWEGYEAERAIEATHAEERYARYSTERDTLTARTRTQRQWAVSGVAKEKKAPRDNDKAQRGFRIDRTEKQASKVRQSERALERLEVVEKPFEGWNLQFTIDEAPRAGAIVAVIEHAVVARGERLIGPIDLTIFWGDRIALTGANGTGKTTLLEAMMGTVAVESGSVRLGPSVVTGVLGQERLGLDGEVDVTRAVMDRTGLELAPTRSLLAKFGLPASHVTRRAASLSPGERTRAELAIFQAKGVNFLVLDEPTNHLDLPAIEQLETALAGFSGTLLLVTHDRRLLERVSVTATIEMESLLA